MPNIITPTLVVPEEKRIVLPSSIFNTEKQDYGSDRLLFGEKRGVFDTSNESHPKIKALHQQLKVQDWDEGELDHTPCVIQFKSCQESEYFSLTDTIAWQWETDTSSANSIVPIMSNFVTNDRLMRAYTRVGMSEWLHAAAYSVIVRTGFENPNAVREDILQRQQAFARLESIAEVFEQARYIGAEYSNGHMKYCNEVYDAAIKFLVANYIMEAVQFVGSFAITFSFGKQGRFGTICDIVQKIAQDEFLTHVPLGEYVLDWEFRTEAGIMAFTRLRTWMIEFLRTIIRRELAWNARQFSNGRELLGLNEELLNRYIFYRATLVAKFLRIPIDECYYQDKDPLPWMDDWLDLNKRQISAQEQRGTNYYLGSFLRDVPRGRLPGFDFEAIKRELSAAHG
jgi:ribonucleoside-diphosphate reductase beta chain